VNLNHVAKADRADLASAPVRNLNTVIQCKSATFDCFRRHLTCAFSRVVHGCRVIGEFDTLFVVIRLVVEQVEEVTRHIESTIAMLMGCRRRGLSGNHAAGWWILSF
jgi:hypothetical protein